MTSDDFSDTIAKRLLAVQLHANAGKEVFHESRKFEKQAVITQLPVVLQATL